MQYEVRNNILSTNSGKTNFAETNLKPASVGKQFKIGVKGQVVCDGGSQVGRLVDHFQLVVADGDDRWCINVLTQHIGLL